MVVHDETHTEDYNMRGTVAKKIRKTVKPLASSTNDGINTPRRLKAKINEQEIEFAVEVRRLKTDSLKFLAGKVKGLFGKLPSTARNKFFSRLQNDVNLLLAQKEAKAQTASE